MSANQSTTMYESVSAVSELNKVQGFDPLKFLRETKEGGKTLNLKYKKLWFRLKYPSGRIKLSPVRITDQLAIIEARVYFDKNDTQPKASFIAQREAKSTPGGLYIESAQHAAIDQALSDAGFGVQFTPASQKEEKVTQTRAENEQHTVYEAAPAVETVTETKKEPAAEVTLEVASTEVPALEETVTEPDAVSDIAAIEEVTSKQPEVAAESAPLGVAETIEEAEGEEVEDETAETGVAGAAYTADMSVEEICSMMTLEEAGNVIVPIGTCKDWTMAQVVDRRPASLKWYINGYQGDDNILRAAAIIMQETLVTDKAS